MTAIPVQTRSTHPRHGISWTYTVLELKRAATRGVTLFFCVLMPVMFYLLFGSMSYMEQTDGRGNGNAAMLAFMAFYGASMTAATQSLTIASERPLGWNRALRLTPLRPWAYMVTKNLTSLIASLVSVGILYLVAALVGRAHMPGWMWLAAVGIAVLGSLTFGALGQVICLMIKSDVATGLIIPILLICCFLSGVFAIPMSGSFFEVLQKIVPMGGMVNLALAMFGPNVTINDTGGMAVGDWRIWVNLIGWIVVLFAAAGLAWRRDTRRQ